MEYIERGYANEEIIEQIFDEVQNYVNSKDQLLMCIRSIRGKHTQGFKPRNNEKSREINNSQNKVITGIVTARKCECCGYHEIGIVIHTGEYVPLKPGMRVEIIGGDSD